MKSLNINAQRVTFTDSGAELEPFTITECPSDRIVVRSRCSSISAGTETLLYLKKWNTDPNVDYERVRLGYLWDMEEARKDPGYALAGDVIEVGDDVQGFQVGDRVITMVGHADYAVCPTEPWRTLKIPDKVTYEEASLVVLASVALHGVRRAKLELGEDLVIMGAGIVGLFAVQFANLCGASPIVSVDLNDSRLELAKVLGADYAVNPSRQDLVQTVKDNIGSDGVTCTIDATGNPSVLQSGLRIARTGGRVVVVGAAVGATVLDMFNDFMIKELQLIAAQQPANPTQETAYYRFTQQKCRQMILDMIANRTIRVDELITHRFDYKSVPAVYDMLGNAKAADLQGQSVNREMIGVLLDWAG